MERFIIAILSTLSFFCFAIVFSHGKVTKLCLHTYEQGGALAVIQSPECSNLAFLRDSSVKPSDNYCLLGTGTLKQWHQGKELYDDNHVFCNLDMYIPLYGRNGLKDVKVGLLAMFDARLDEEASKIAREFFEKFFLVNAYFLHDLMFATDILVGTLPHDDEHFMDFQLPNWDEDLVQPFLKLDRSQWSLPKLVNDTTHVEILKEALSRTMHDIDLTFSVGLLNSTHIPGCIATVVLMVKGQILVVNGCGYKSLLCTNERWHRSEDLKDEDIWIDLSAENSLANHYHYSESHPQPAQSQSADGVHLSRHDSMIIPEVLNWHSLDERTFLVVASAAIFERLSQRTICTLATGGGRKTAMKKGIIRSCYYPPSLPDCVADVAYMKGKMEGIADDDNFSVAVVPLVHAGFGVTDPWESQLIKKDPILRKLMRLTSFFDRKALEFAGPVDIIAAL